MPLRQPLGTRQIVDPNWYPAKVVDLGPLPATPAGTMPEVDRIELSDAVVTSTMHVAENVEGSCTATSIPCPVATPLVARLDVTAGSGAASGWTNAAGVVDLGLPQAVVGVRPDAVPGRWCPTIVIDARDGLASANPGTGITCTRLDLPHGTVSGSVSPGAVSVPSDISFRRTDAFGQDVAVAIGPDGRFEAVLPPGRWTPSFSAVVGCALAPPYTVTVTDGTPATLDVACR